MEKPTNVRVAEALGRTVEHHGGDYPGWYVQSTRPGWESIGGFETYWDKIPDYDTDPAAAWAALEAYCDQRTRYRSSVDRTNGECLVMIHEDPLPGNPYPLSRLKGHGKAPTMPAAVCQAILSAERK